jgi:hypothetical protein
MLTFSSEEILETIRMVEMQGLDIRAVTLSLNLLDCAGGDITAVRARMREKILRVGGRLIEVCDGIQRRYGVPIVNKRVALTPISLVASSTGAKDYVPIAMEMDAAARDIGVDFIGGFSALVHGGMTPSDEALITSIPEALSRTEFVMSAVNVATTRAGINMDAVARMGHVIKETARLTADRHSIGCGRLAVFANLPEDVPFMPGAHHGIGLADAVINVGISGPGVVLDTLKGMAGADFSAIAEAIKRTVFKITRMGELAGTEVARELGVAFGSVDLSLAPTTDVGDSVAHILEAMGLESVGAPGTTAALALLNDAVKKGGAMGTSHPGGFSGAFIPVSEDEGMTKAVERGALTIEKLEAMTSVCAVGLDMIIVPGDTPAETISAIIADAAAIGVVNNKTNGVRIIPAFGKKVGDRVEFAGHKGLLGYGVVMPVSTFSPLEFIRRGGRIPPPLRSLGN